MITVSRYGKYFKYIPGSAVIIMMLAVSFMASCSRSEVDHKAERLFYHPDDFVMGADLSYVNEILDHGGVYRDSGHAGDPYAIFARYGTNAARFRLFHTPRWTSELYGGEPMYHHFEDVLLGIQRAKEQGMRVLLDFHYSDNWADPARQVPPAAWQDLEPQALGDSIYNYTFSTLRKLGDKGLMPEYVQVGNEINPGFVLPHGDRWDNTATFVSLVNRAIEAVRDAAAGSGTQTRLILHIAQPENAAGWLEGLDARGLADYDIIGLSYYYIWSELRLDELGDKLQALRQQYDRDIMILETAYPWTLENADEYPNIMDVDKIVPHYPATEAGQYKYLKKLVQEIMDGGGKGIFYWEPAWISSEAKTQWGTGSAFDNNTLFDFDGNVLEGMDYMTYDYELLRQEEEGM